MASNNVKHVKIDGWKTVSNKESEYQILKKWSYYAVRTKLFLDQRHTVS